MKMTDMSVKINRELIWPAAACFLVLIFLLPIATGHHGIFIDDLRTFNYPNAVFQARTLQAGKIPLWDPHTFAGALPFYTRLDAFAFYLPQWLVGLLGESAPGDLAYQQLLLLPIVAHYLWSCLGAYILGRWGLKLSRPGASMLALTYSLSTSMLAGMFNPPMAVALSWHPWMAVSVLLYGRFRRSGWLIFGAVIFALAAPAWPYYTIHGLFLSGLFGLFSVFSCIRRQGWPSALRLTFGLLFMVFLSFLLSAPFWWSLLEGSVSARKTFEINYDFITGGPRSVPFRYWATIFIPELFGSTNFSYIWGVAERAKMYWCEATPTRGLLLWLPAILAIWAGLVELVRKIKERLSSSSSSVKIYNSSNTKRSRASLPSNENSLFSWTWFGLFLVIFSIFLMMGRYTPVFKILYRICPLFRIPYATRWHTLYTMGLAILTGIGVTKLMDIRLSPPIANRKRIGGYLIFVTAIASAAVFFPIGYWRNLTDIGWWMRVPGLYWIICVVTLGLLCIFWKQSRVSRIIVLFALIGLLRSAWWDAYRPMGITWAPEQELQRGPSESSLFRFAAFAAAFSRAPFCRTGYSRVFADNGALLYGDYSLLGVCVKPMIPRMYHLLNELCSGWPYELSLSNPGLPFVDNMSTDYWWGDKLTLKNLGWEYLTTDPETNQALFRNPLSLPRFYIQDRVVICSEEEARSELIKGNLRRAVFIEDTYIKDLAGRSPGGIIPTVNYKDYYSSDRKLPTGELFDYLQGKNRIFRYDFSNPNRIELDLSLSRPAMLVITDVWHPAWQAIDNGRSAPIYRVNYLQRGIWLEEGGHRLLMEFRPPAIYSGRWISLFGAVIIFILLIVVIGKCRIFRLP